MAGPADIGAGRFPLWQEYSRTHCRVRGGSPAPASHSRCPRCTGGTFCRFPPLCASRSGRIVRSVILRAAVIRMHMNAVFRQLITAFRVPVTAGCPLLCFVHNFYYISIPAACLTFLHRSSVPLLQISISQYQDRGNDHGKTQKINGLNGASATQPTAAWRNALHRRRDLARAGR